MAAAMRFAVDFDRKAVTWAEEVEHIAAGRMLAAEAQAIGARPQHLPKDHFGQCHGTSQRAGAALRVLGAVEHGATYPSTIAAQWSPSPSRGRIAGGRY